MSIKNIIRAVKRLFCSKTEHGTRSGTIKFFDRKKRFGFIVSGKQEYFFHAAATNPGDFKSLQDGVAVTFTLVEGKKGLQADTITIVSS